MTPEITLSENRTAKVEEYQGRPTIRVYENGRKTPGSWFAHTLAERPMNIGPIAIDFGARWNLTLDETALLVGFAVGVLAMRGTVSAAEFLARPAAYNTRAD
jgi:hypothetical protein